MNNRDFASRMITLIDGRIKKLTRGMAMVETTWGEVSATDVGAKTVDVYLYGQTVASEDFRVVGGAVPQVGTWVKVAMDKATGDRWVVEPIVAVASTSGDSLAHADLTGVTPNQHHNQAHSITSSDHTTSEMDTDKRLAPDGAGGVEWVDGGGGGGHEIREAGTPLTQRDGLNFGLGFDLTDDAGNNETDVALDLLELTDFTDHSARHVNGGADEIEVEDLATAETDTTKFLRPDGAGGLEFGSGTTVAGINFVIDGGGVTIAAGSKGYVEVPYDCTVTAARLAANATGSIVVDVKKATYSGLFTFTSICASAKPTLSTARKSEDTTLTGWTTSLSAGDWLEFVVDSASTVQRVTVALTLSRSI